MNLTYLGDVGSHCGRQINQNLSGLRKWRYMYLLIIIVFSIAMVLVVLIVVLLKSFLWVQVTLGKLIEVIASYSAPPLYTWFFISWVENDVTEKFYISKTYILHCPLITGGKASSYILRSKRKTLQCLTNYLEKINHIFKGNKK